jgi:hypothetical protein
MIDKGKSRVPVEPCQIIRLGAGTPMVGPDHRQSASDDLRRLINPWQDAIRRRLPLTFGHISPRFS